MEEDVPRAGGDEGHRRVARSFPDRLDSLREVSEWIRGVARTGGLSEDRIGDVELAVNELMTNVVLYAWDDRGAHELLFEVESRPDGIRVSIEDDGRPFDPSRAARPDPVESLATAPEGGGGISLARSVVDDLRYDRIRGKNRTTLLVRATPKAGRAGKGESGRG